MKSSVLTLIVTLITSYAATAGEVVNSRNVTPIDGGYVVSQGAAPASNQQLYKSVQQLTPVPPPAQANTAQTQAVPQMESMKKASGFAFNPNAATAQTVGNAPQTSLYDTVVKPIAARYGLPPELIGGLIQARNPSWNAAFDEGNGKPKHGYGLGMVTLAAAKGKTATELYDPNTNVEIMAQILSRGVKLYGQDINKLIRFYLYGIAQTVGTEKEQNVLNEMGKLGFGKR